MTQSTNNYDVFLSHSRKDVRRAREIFEALGRQGWSVFFDETMPNATLWERYILNHLESVRCVFVLWSEAARTSEWVQREAATAARRQRLVHARLDTTLPPGEFSKYQASDLANWAGESRDSEWMKVLAAIASHVGTRGSLGTLEAPEPFEMVTDNHLALTSSSWRKTGPKANLAYPWQIHLNNKGWGYI